MFFEDGEYKVKLTLSSSYYDRFCSDLFTFDIKSSTLITAIVHAYCEDSKKLPNFENSKKSSAFEICQSDYAEILLSRSLRFSKALKKLSGKETAEQDSKRKRRYFIKGSTKTVQWRFGNDIREEMKLDSRSHNQPLTFIRDLIEEYLDLPFEKRESVVLYKQIQDVEHAIRQNKAFKYTYKSGVSCVMHPYKIMDDPDIHFKYVVGHRINADQYDPSTFVPSADNVATIRLLNMQYTKDNFIILSNERQLNEEAIEEKLTCSSVAFLSEDACDITVLLNKTGENMFRTIVHNRPRFISCSEQYEDGFRCYKLKGTPFQASVYFCSFENNAQIINPPEAVEAIRSRLEKANSIYFPDKK